MGMDLPAMRCLCKGTSLEQKPNPRQLVKINVDIDIMMMITSWEPLDGADWIRLNWSRRSA